MSSDSVIMWFHPGTDDDKSFLSQEECASFVARAFMAGNPNLVSYRIVSLCDIPKLDTTNSFISDGVNNAKWITEWESEDTGKCNTKPSFAEAKRQGLVVMNPYTASKTVLKRFVGDVAYPVGTQILRIKTKVPAHGSGLRFKHINGSETGVFPFIGNITLQGTIAKTLTRDVSINEKLEFPVFTVPSSLETRVTTDLLAQVASADFDVSTFAGELRESYDMLRDVFPRLALDLIKLKKTYFRLPAATRKQINTKYHQGYSKKELKNMLKAGPDALADYWLLWRYGVKPIGHDIDNFHKSLDRVKTVFETVRTGDSVALESKGWVGSIKASAHGVWKGGFSPSQQEAFKNAKARSFYLPSTLWELTPYSFIADWFLNIGDSIAATRPMPNCQSDYCVSVKLDVSLHKEKSIYFPAENYTKTGSIKIDGRYYEAQLDIFSPEVDTKIITHEYSEQSLRRGQGQTGIAFTSDLSLNQTYDAFALLWGRIRKSIR